MGRPREFNRPIAVETAVLVFWREGFPGASVEGLCNAMGVGSSSFYAAFGSKEELFREALACYLAKIERNYRCCLDGADNARDSVAAFLSAAATRLPATDETPGGCMIGLGAVSEAWPQSTIELLREGRARLVNMICEKLNDAVARGELPADTDVARWSRFYMAAYQGMAAQARDGATTADLRDLAMAAMGAWPAST